jgi:hypothetical protein
MFPGPNASANVVLNIITEVKAHHVFFRRTNDLPRRLLCFA